MRPAKRSRRVKQLAAEAITRRLLEHRRGHVDARRTSASKTLDEQQRLNYETAADIAAYVRQSRARRASTISIGAEIGEVGTQNSTVAEERAFMDGYLRTMKARGHGTLAPLSKISVQTGTSHGGVVLPDGSIADVKLDLKALEDLSKVARSDYGMAGAVQHGASTLPETAFNHFPRIETAEIHLATNFQNILYDHLPDRAAEAHLPLAGRERQGGAEADGHRRSVLSTRRERRRSVRSRPSSGNCRRRRGWN